ncbi:MAG: hypothetical protein US52_C0024G0009 [candidate division WS6 bacterium GW2011_GWA2_37_6]|uniref:Uncharacterized protein n=1 Tax=candidate division WS6 bacterium GW2011_GWA2_37_6 TaxID=1619087 RepID=A0A0G0HAA8_9BACT|nr:MAG: hypothetical protein US52_C0024G0009 [candidate division WS6 bacterium GW2011_GWA2_37_6]
MNIFKILKELNFPLGQYVVVGGAMAAHGIREAHDLDILVTPNLYERLLNEGWKQCTCEQCMKTSRLMLKGDDVDILPNFMYKNYIGDTKSLIDNADIIKGFPFIKLEEFMKFKKELGRQKDVKDIKLMKAILKG